MPVLKVKNGDTWLNVSAGSGVAIQSDWSQNDETNAAYIKNRPFYEEHNVLTTLLPSTEFGPFEFNDMFNAYMCQAPATFEPVVGNTYKITWDGVEYECVAQDANAVMSGAIVIGNASAFGLAGNDEPFAIAYSNTYMGYMSYTEGNHTVAIEGNGNVVHKLNTKYLPDGIGYTEVITKNETFDIIQIANDFGAEWTTLPESESPIGKTVIDLGIESEEALINFTIGNEYQVVINGISYTSNAADLSSVLGAPVLAIGDYNSMLSQDYSNFKYMVLGGRTDERHFAFVVRLDAETFGSVPTEFTISGLTNTEIIHKIDSKCLPEDVAFLDDIPEVPSQIVNTVNGMTGDVTIESGGVGEAGVGENAEVFNGINSRNAFGSYSHAEGNESYSFGEVSHAENHSIASGAFSHAEGYAASVYGFSFFGDGNSETYTVTDDGYLPRVDSVIWYNNAAARVIAVDYENRTFTVNNALLSPSVQDPIRVHSNIISLGALGDCSHSEGENTSAWSKCSHAEGDSSESIGIASHAEGYSSNAVGDYSHAEGNCSTAAHEASHAEGDRSYARGYAAHAENQSWAIGEYSHSEGVSYPDNWPRHFSYSAVNENDLTVFQVEPNSGVENYIEIGYYADFGWTSSIRKVIDFDKDNLIFTINEPLDKYEYADTVNHYVTFHSSGIASGDYSHSEGIGSIAASVGQHVQGRYNLVDSNDRYAHIVGNGSGFTNTERSNAHTLDWDGNAWFKGNVFVGGTSQSDADRLVRLSELSGLGGSGSSIQSDWNQNDESALDYIKNKPFYTLEESWEIVWDGNISNQDNVISTGKAENILYYVSETVPSEKELKKATMTLIQNGESASVELSSVWDNIATITEDLIEIGGAVIITKKDNVTYMDTITFPRAGVYFASMQSATYVSKLEKVGNIKKIDPKYLPFAYGTEDLDAGTSQLDTGTLYFVYE